MDLPTISIIVVFFAFIGGIFYSAYDLIMLDKKETI